MHVPFRCHSLALFLALLPIEATLAQEPPCGPLRLQIQKVEPPPTQYREFCGIWPRQCTLRGDDVVPLDAMILERLSAVNRAVNREIVLLADINCQGRLEVWSLPEDGYGDCEDVALEKRRRLALAGFPSAALTMAIVHHRERFFAHAVLLVETDGGTFVLDNQTDRILCWASAPYEFERRERPDGDWVRFLRPNRPP